MGFADSDKKLVLAYIITSRTRPHSSTNAIIITIPEKVQSVLFVSPLLTKMPWQDQKMIHGLCYRRLKSWQYSQKTGILWAETALHGQVCHGAEGPQGMLLRQKALLSLEGQPLSEVAQGIEPATHPIEISDNPLTFMGLICHCCHCPVPTHFILPPPCIHPLMPPRKNKVAWICRLKLCARNLDI